MARDTTSGAGPNVMEFTSEQSTRLGLWFDAAKDLPQSGRESVIEGVRRGEGDAMADELARRLTISDSTTDTIDAPQARRRRAGTQRDSAFHEGDMVLGRFQIVRLLGRGGMGEVYEAHDQELGPVALKTIRSDLIGDAATLRRFKQEVHLARQVTSPYVCRIHELFMLPDTGPQLVAAFLTMELLAGVTLARRIAQGPLPWSEAEPIALKLCQGLEALHAVGLVHRDFKPANVMLTRRGTETHAVVMDFGLALRHEEPRMTVTVSIAGTPGYMAPEQVEGGRVSPATDIYALGLVLCEMVTGKRPFEDAVAVGTGAKRTKRIPAVSSMGSGIPRRVDKVIEKCLQFEPADRFASAGEVATALMPGGPRGASAHGAWGSALRAGAGMAAVLALVGAVLIAVHPSWLFLRPSTPPSFIQVTNQPGEQLFPTLSPDGARIAYSWEQNGDSDIYTQAVGGGQTVDITADCKSADSEPAWSPDGQRIAYRCERDGGSISITAADGTWNRRLTSVGHQPSWSPDGTQLVVATERAASSSGLTTDVSPLWIVDVKNGSVHALGKANGFQPSWSPHGNRIAFWTLAEGRIRIRTAEIQSGAVSELVSDTHTNWNPVWSADGRWIYFLSDRGGSMNLWRIGVDENSGERNGEPEPVTLPATDAEHISVSRDGRSIAYVQRTVTANLFRIPLNSNLKKAGTPIQLTSGARLDTMPSISSDGGMLAFISGAGKPEQIYVMPANGASPPRQITDNTDKSVRYQEPHWSPDGKLIAFQSNATADAKGLNQIWSIRPDGSDLRQLTHIAQQAVSPVWNPDGSGLVYSVIGGHPWFLRMATLQAEEFAAPPDRSMQFIAKAWSADGSRIAGTLLRPDGPSGGISIYTVSDRKYEVISSTGMAPVWLKDGVHLLFRSGSSLYMEDTRTHSAIQLTLPPAVHVSDTFALANDNRWLIVSSSTEQANVWLARNVR
jgi:eukaryotic-like serine/threonine-protein kinase